MTPVVAVLVAMALVVSAMGVAWLVTKDDGDAGANSSTSAVPATTSTTAGSSTSTAPGAPAGDIESVVADLSDFVEQQRGLQFKHPVDVELADDQEFEQRLLDDFQAEDEVDLRDSEAIFRALGFIGDDVDLVDALRGVLSAGVLGFYDPETNELVVRGAEATPYAKVTIVHELTHALDDQHFELFRPELDDADDEASFAFGALTEGNARTVENAYRDSLSADEQAEVDREEQQFAGGTDFSQFPEIVLALIQAPYDFGEPFVGAVVDAQGEDGVDAAFEDPPVSSEQIIDPTRYLSGEVPLDVAEPPADGESFDQGTFGELLLFLLLQDGGVDQSVARDAAVGWGGDQYVAWHEGDQTCIRIAFEGDTDQDTSEIADAIGDWAGQQSGADVRTNGAGQPTLTSCG